MTADSKQVRIAVSLALLVAGAVNSAAGTATAQAPDPLAFVGVASLGSWEFQGIAPGVDGFLWPVAGAVEGTEYDGSNSNDQWQLVGNFGHVTCRNGVADFNVVFGRLPGTCSLNVDLAVIHDNSPLPPVYYCGLTLNASTSAASWSVVLYTLAETACTEPLLP